MRVSLLFLAFLSTFATNCKTTRKHQASEVSSWGGAEEKEMARQRFLQALRECVPLISGAYPGAKTVTLAGDPVSEKVMQDFVSRLIQEPSSTAERSARLLDFYYKEKGNTLPPCAGDAAEYVLTEFAAQTNIVKIALREETVLKLEQ